ncbi:hypothetical protein ACO22_01749 [Paracoccidioides brasiliensis]|uniref:Uncharacterized protein n=1 Tax=Paracoccidioides brasiliensis TaxID=121759 RepID=A0A1D2JL15_PARBR|nr:hypothetical protein ACO22_01749 [Paracoccidioides brasiliensis]
METKERSKNSESPSGQVAGTLTGQGQSLSENPTQGNSLLRKDENTLLHTSQENCQQLAPSTSNKTILPIKWFSNDPDFESESEKENTVQFTLPSLQLSQGARPLWRPSPLGPIIPHSHVVVTQVRMVKLLKPSTSILRCARQVRDTRSPSSIWPPSTAVHGD